MKKLIAITFAIVMAAAAFTGCNGGEKAGSAVSQAASGAGSMVDKAGEGAKKAGSAIDDNAESMISNGQVSDGDGVIGNEGKHVEQEVETTE